MKTIWLLLACNHGMPAGSFMASARVCSITCVPCARRVIQEISMGEPVYGRGTPFVLMLDPFVEHGIQQIRQLDPFFDQGHRAGACDFSVPNRIYSTAPVNRLVRHGTRNVPMAGQRVGAIGGLRSTRRARRYQRKKRSRRSFSFGPRCP